MTGIDLLVQTFRRLRRSPGTALTAAGVLGLGIGAAVAVFAVFDAVLLTPPPYERPDRLVLVERIGADGHAAPVAAPDAAAYGAAASVQGVGYVHAVRDGVLAGADGASAVRVGVASSSLFEVLGVRPVAGRLIAPAEAVAEDAAAPGPAPVLVSHAFWRNRLGGAPPGAVLDVDGAPATVVGVLPPDFRLVLPPGAGIAARADVWIPLRVPLSELRRPEGLRDQDSDNRGIVVARLSEGVSLRQAAAELRTVDRRIEAELGESSGVSGGLRVSPLQAAATAAARPLLLLLFGAVLLVLLLTAANVAGLLLARSSRRTGELAVRAALGATRGRLAAMVAAEGALIGVAAGGIGVLLGVWGTDLLVHFGPPLLDDVRPGIDGRVLAFALLVTIVATALAAAVPAIRSGDGRLLPTLRARTTTESRETARARRALVTVEIALSLALLAGAGLLVRTVVNLGRLDPGFDARPVTTFDLALIDPALYRGPADRGRFVRRLVDGLEAVPSVAAAAVVGGLPLSGETFTQPWGRPGESPEEWSGEANLRVVSDRYFDVLGTTIVRGRAFRPADDRQDRRVVVIGRDLADALAPGGDALGRSIAFPLDGDAVDAEVVGVVEEVRFQDLRTAGRPTIYVPYRHEASRRITVAVRGRDGRPVPESVLRDAVEALDPGLPLFGYAPMQAHVRRATADSRFALAVLVGFAALAGLLATVAVYALVAFSVASRTAELAVRMAMGADPTTIGRMILRDVASLVLPGLGLGLAAAALLGFLGRALLFGVGPTDPVVLATVTALVALAALLAAAAPAGRAARLRPAAVLRQ